MASGFSHAITWGTGRRGGGFRRSDSARCFQITEDGGWSGSVGQVDEGSGRDGPWASHRLEMQWNEVTSLGERWTLD